MSAHLQFGPEWMRKGRGKTSTSIGGTSDAAVTPQEVVSPSIPSAVIASKPLGTTSRKHPSLGNLSAASSTSGPSSHTIATTPSPGAFSFAAAAQAGSAKELQQHSLSTASSSTTPLGSTRLLSLYSSERGGKAPSQETSSSATVQASKSTANTTNASGISERDTRRTANSSIDGSAMFRPHTPPNAEPRGLNARTVSSSQEKAAPAVRPGLFQRGSHGSSSIVTNAAHSPTTLFQSRDRDRHGTGIQGGVLSGVAAPLSARRRKESEPGLGIETLRSPRTPMDAADHQWDQRRTNDAFTSARNRSNRTTAPHDLTSVDAHAVGAAGDRERGGVGGVGVGVGVTNAPSVSSNGEVIETWSRLGGRRERAPGEGPIGPPSDHSGGFARFAGYERKRERQATMPAPKQSSAAASERRDRDEGHSSSDVDLSKHATYVLDSLKLDDDEDDFNPLDMHVTPQQQQQQQQQQAQQQQQIPQQQHHLPDWSPETQDWLYRDPSGQVQGPFKANLMQDWYAANYFDSELLVRRVEDDAFQPLGETLVMIGNAVSPFLVPPIAYARRAHNGKVDPVQEQLASYTEAPSQQQPTPSNPLGWPGNLDILNHYGNGSGHSSPFATPQGRFAELDGGSRIRQKTQQEQYNEMIRQRELAEQRAIYEQRAAQMAAIAMAQQQGRDPASLGLWGTEAMLGSEWNQMLNQPQSHFDRSEELRYHQQQIQQQQHQQYQHQQQQEQQQQQQQYYDQVGYQAQPAWNAQTLSRGIDQGDGEGKGDVVQQAAEPLTGSAPEERAPPQETAVIDDNSTQSAVEALAGAESHDPARTGEDAAIEEAGDMVGAAEEEQSPEQVWPQSPTAVEFASEPLMSEEQWSKEESPSRGKKSRRDKTKQKTDDEVKQDRTAARVNSGSIKTVSEDQFRRSQGGSRESSTTSVQTPLSSWLPDTPAGVAVPKSAPWASNAQENAGLSLREIQEAEARQAEARRAARPRLQLNASPSSDGSALPTTMSWGLASSHANNGRDAVSTPPAVVTPAWNARQAPKKTLMEIQEEEQKRAQRVKEAQTAQTEGKSKAYADSASKMQTPSNNGMASSWSVVGAGGKPSTTPTSVLSRPTKTNTSPVVQRTVSSSNANIGPTSKLQTTPRKSAVDGASAPSANFIRYCKEQLKGVNVKVDDFIEMLLSFPIDPTPDVVEIIAESVYASSSTLDGRRFAADFVAKRKLDANQGKSSSGANKGSAPASAQANGPGSASNTRSLSDVLKTAPSSSNDGFGGFKVVKAKGAKKR